MRIGYSKIGRAWKLDPRKGTATGGDTDVARTLHILARSRPNDQFYLLGRNSGEDPQAEGYPSNVINPWIEWAPRLKAMKCGQDVDKLIAAIGGLTLESFAQMDRHIIWAGQHGTSNTRIPSIEDRSVTTNPQISFANYCAFIIEGLNAWRDRVGDDLEEIWLCPDPRNYLKARDIKWPLRGSIIAQFEQTRETKHERFGDTLPPWPGVRETNGLWIAPSRYTYDALELTALPHPDLIPFDPVPLNHRYDFGMVVNENRAYVARDRLSVLRDWVMPHWPEAEIFGVWSDKAKDELKRRDIRPVPYEHLGSALQRWACTLTTPASGSGWATAKPWECFAYGTVCFFHPQYDTQGHILKDAPAELRDLLMVDTPFKLRDSINAMRRYPNMWLDTITMQREYYERKYAEHAGGTRAIQERLMA